MYFEDYENEEMNEEIEENEVENEEVNEEGQSDEELNENEETSKEESEEQQQEEQAQTYNDVNQRVINKVVARERTRAEREREPYEELAHVLRQGFGVDENTSISDLTDRAKSFYEENGQNIERYVPKENKHDSEILAKADARDIIEAGDSEIISEYERLKGKDNLSYRESILFNELQSELAIKGAEIELSKNGKDKNILRDDNFKNFASRYRSYISILDIYDDYMKMTENKEVKEVKKEPLPAGSMKSNNNEKNKIKSFYTPDEVDNFTQKELIENPKLLDAINKSMEKW